MTKRGRPKKSDHEKRWQRLDLRVSEAEKEAFRLAAENAGQDLSVWIRIQLHRSLSDTVSGATSTEEQNDSNTSEANSNRIGPLR